MTMYNHLKISYLIAETYIDYSLKIPCGRFWKISKIQQLKG